MHIPVPISYSITNLKYWTSSKTIVSKTLQLLTDLSIGWDWFDAWGRGGGGLAVCVKKECVEVYVCYYVSVLISRSL